MVIIPCEDASRWPFYYYLIPIKSYYIVESILESMVFRLVWFEIFGTLKFNRFIAYIATMADVWYPHLIEREFYFRLPEKHSLSLHAKNMLDVEVASYECKKNMSLNLPTIFIYYFDESSHID